MSELVPTTRLRFVQRPGPAPWTQEAMDAAPQLARTYLVLQQWWEGERWSSESDTFAPVGEWRDVPIEVES